MVLCGPNENKMSDGGRGRASLGVKVWKSSQKWSVRRSAVRSIVAWLGLLTFMDILNDPIAELGRVIKIRVRLFRLATARCQGPVFGANFLYRGSNVCPWDFNVHRPRVRCGVRVLPTNINRRSGLHIRHGAVGGLCDLEDGHVQLERRIAGKTLLNGTRDCRTAQNQNSDRS